MNIALNRLPNKHARKQERDRIPRLMEGAGQPHLIALNGSSQRLRGKRTAMLAADPPPLLFNNPLVLDRASVILYLYPPVPRQIRSRRRRLHRLFSFR